MAKPFFSAYSTILAFFTAAMTKTTPFTFRVVSYNVLSSHLASPSHFSTLDPQHLEASARLPKILDKLEEQIAKASAGEPVIFCLQEVSYQWAGKLHTFFANRGFHVVTGLYGKPFNGYMGVLTAWPTSELETVDVDISRLSDTIKWPKATDEGSSILGTFYETTIRKPLQWMGLSKPPPESHWSIAQRRYNVLLTAILRDKKSGKEFCIGNYHMPCIFVSQETAQHPNARAFLLFLTTAHCLPGLSPPFHIQYVPMVM
jgi:2',5'-phosphodiesterase